MIIKKKNLNISNSITYIEKEPTHDDMVELT